MNNLEKILEEFEKKFIKISMWELVPNTPRKIMASDKDVAKLMVNIKSFLTKVYKQAHEEGRQEAIEEIVDETRYEIRP